MYGSSRNVSNSLLRLHPAFGNNRSRSKASRYDIRNPISDHGYGRRRGLDGGEAMAVIGPLARATAVVS